MDTKESEELISVFSSFMFNRKYKIHSIDNNYTTQSKNVVSLKDYKFYNKRLLNFYKTLLLNNQSRTINEETLLYINKIPNDLIELGNKFIEESILFFKREDTNEIIQQELIKKDDIPNEDNDKQTNHTELLENTNDIDMKYYFSKNNSSPSGTFHVIEEENENSDIIGISLPQQRQYHLRDNSFRLKGITKNNNMSILYEQDEQENSQLK